jgi:RNA polymerase sigma factor (sigma-70 family)
LPRQVSGVTIGDTSIISISEQGLQVNVTSLSLNDLAQRCIEETSKFRRNVENDTRFCYELMRRAFKENFSDALTHIFVIYEPLVRSWVYAYIGFADTEEQAEDFVSAAFSAFYFALREKNFDDFPHLAKLLAYLKMCVHTTIAQYKRKQKGIQIESIEPLEKPGNTPDPGDKVDRELIWKRIEEMFPDEHDKLLIRCYFVYDLKPAEISTRYSMIWGTSRDVSVNLQRIRRALRGDDGLHELLGAV